MDGSTGIPRSRGITAVVLAIAAVVVIALIASHGGSDGHKVSVVVREATNVVPGQYIKEAGAKVGEVKKLTAIDHGRAARIDMEIDDSAWPLPQGSKMTLRWGGTVNYSNRYIDLVRGPDNAPPIVADGGRFPTKSFTTPVEFDALLRTFNAPLRRDLRGFLEQGGVTLKNARSGLRRTLDVSPGAVEQAGSVLRDLDAERFSIQTLVRSADRVVGAADSAQPGLRTLLGGAATTFDAIAAQAASLQQSLDKAPQMLSVTRSTLARADRTLDLASTVTSRIAPGVTQLRRVSAPLNDTLRTVVRIAPDAKSTLATAGRATKDLDPLLTEVTGRSPQLKSIGEQSVDNLNCIRPYTPSIFSFFSDWGDFFAWSDGKDKIIRATVQNFLPAESNAMPYNSGQAAKMFPGMTFGFPRPPGTDAGQPWFLPQCGAGPDALDPDKDPEARPYKQVFQMPSLKDTIMGEVSK